MEILYLLIPIALILAGLIVAGLFWAIKSGQFDDLEGPAHQILWDEDERITRKNAQERTPNEAEKRPPASPDKD